MRVISKWEDCINPRVKAIQASLVAQTVKNLPAMWETRV